MEKTKKEKALSQKIAKDSQRIIKENIAILKDKMM